MIDHLTPPKFIEDRRLFIMTPFGNEQAHWLADSLLRRIAEQPLCAPVPALDDAIQIFADDRVIGMLHDRGQPCCVFVGALPVCDICGDPSHRVDFPVRFAQRELDREVSVRPIKSKSVFPRTDSSVV